MSLNRLVFVGIDVFFDRPQNRRKFTRYEGTNFIWDRDVVYSPENADCCTLDVCREEGKGSYPVLFYIHGGGFVAGDKYYRRAISRWGAKCGCAVVNVNYGLCPQYKFPAQHVQLAKALEWVERNAEKYNFDLTRIVVAGDSAGAYFATMLACMSVNGELAQRLGVDVKLKFRAAIFNSGIFDTTILARKRSPFGMFKKLFMQMTGTRARDAKSFEWLDICNAAEFATPDFPESFFTYSKRDIFCKGQSEYFIEKLTKSGVSCRSYSSNSLIDNHCFSINNNDRAARANNKLVQSFLLEVIAKKE